MPAGGPLRRLPTTGRTKVRCAQCAKQAGSLLVLQACALGACAPDTGQTLRRPRDALAITLISTF